MKKLSEVCKIVGVTRRALQEYDRIGLVKPTAKTEAGYWLYDEATIQKLILVRIYAEAGYKRTEIKSLLAMPTINVLKEFDSIIEMLEEKRRRIDGMISTIKAMQLLAKMPDSVYKFMENLDIAQVYREKNFSACLKEMISVATDYGEEDREESNLWIGFCYTLMAIGYSKGTPAGAEKVQSVVEELYRFLEEIMPDTVAEDSSSETNASGHLTEEDNIEMFCEIISDMMENSEMYQIIEQQCGTGAVEQILVAVKVFGSNYLSERQ